MIRKVVVVTPFFPPINTPDIHRVRQSLIHWIESNVEVTVICADWKQSGGVYDPDLLLTVPVQVKIIRLKSIPLFISKFTGFNSIAYRILPALFLFGTWQVFKRSPDIIYFSTTMFPVAVVGRLWRWLINKPIVIDMQDPWRSDIYLNLPKAQRPPKFIFSYTLDKWMEKWVMSKIDGIICVSPSYISMLMDRYKKLRREQFKVIPFGVSEQDMRIAEKLATELPYLEKGKINLVYTGVCNKHMLPVIRLFLSGFQSASMRFPDKFKNVRIVFIGTSYVQGKNQVLSVTPIASELGIESTVKEYPERVQYLTAVKYQQESSGLLLIGTTDKTYTPSKLYPYLLSKKPVISFLHEESPAVEIFKSISDQDLFVFNEINENQINKMVDYLTDFIDSIGTKKEINENEMLKYKSESMAQLQMDFFIKIQDDFNGYTN